MLARTTFAIRRLAVSSAVKPVAIRSFSTSMASRGEDKKGLAADYKSMKSFHEIKKDSDLMPPGAPVGSVPSDLEQATGLERLEILGKLEGVDIFDMAPLDATRLGTMMEPIVVKSYGEERYLGCTGFPADSHNVIWLTSSKERPVTRCPECGSVYQMDYIGQDEHHDDHGHGHDDHGAYAEPKTMADFVKADYKW